MRAGDATRKHAFIRKLAGRATVVLLGVLAWLALGTLIPGVSERFFLLVPPLYLAHLAGHWRSRPGGFAKHLRLPTVALACLILACASYNLVLTGGWRGLRVLEVAVSVWFVIAVVLIGLQLRSMIGPAGCGDWLAACVGRTRVGRHFGRLMGESAAIALIAPFLFATFHVHRFKVPNLVTPREFAGRAYENVIFETTDGLTLRGWFVPAESPSRRTLLVCHGMGTNRSALLPLIRLGDALRANLLFFDFRGHGESDGHTVSFGFREQEDVLAAIRYLRTNRAREAEEIVGMGTSMGAAALVGAAAEVDIPFFALVLDSSFAVAAEITDPMLSWLPDWVRPAITMPGLLCASLDASCWVSSLRPVDQVSRVRGPVIVLHSRHDSLVPLEHAERLYAAAKGRKALWIAEKGDHSSAWKINAEYISQVLQLLGEGSSLLTTKPTTNRPGQ